MWGATGSDFGPTFSFNWFPVTWISIARFPKAFLVVLKFPNEVKGVKTFQPEAFPFAKKENKANGLSETENKANRLRYTKAIHKDSAILVSNSNLSFNTCGRFSSKVLVSEVVFCIVRNLFQ